MSFYNYFATPVSDPETGNLAFIPATSLPYETLRGGGKFYDRSFDVHIKPLLYGQERVINGLEGIEYTGLQSQGLIDMEAYIRNLQAAG